MPALKRRPLKTIPWEKYSDQLKAAVQAWVDSGGAPEKLKDVERITKLARQAAEKETPPRKKVLPAKKRRHEDVAGSLFYRVVDGCQVR